MAKLINMCPHGINIIREDGTRVDIAKDPRPAARCTQTEIKVTEVDGIAITKQVFGEVTNLPEAEPDTFFIVSRMVAAAVPDRHDLLIPGPLVRDENGQPCGCRGLSVVL